MKIYFTYNTSKRFKTLKSLALILFLNILQKHLSWYTCVKAMAAQKQHRCPCWPNQTQSWPHEGKGTMIWRTEINMSGRVFSKGHAFVFTTFFFFFSVKSQILSTDRNNRLIKTSLRNIVFPTNNLYHSKRLRGKIKGYYQLLSSTSVSQSQIKISWRGWNCLLFF